MGARIKSDDPLDVLVTHVAQEPEQHVGYPSWRIIYASGRHAVTTSADEVQSILQATHQGNRRTSR